MASCNPSQPGPARLDNERFTSIVTALQALAHPVRLKIVESMARHGGELCVCQIQEGFDLTQPTISHHLRVLRDAGLVASRQDGTWVHYRIQPHAIAEVSGSLDSLSADLSVEEISA